MSRFFHRHQKAIIWIVVIAFFIGGVGLIGLNQAGIFRSAPTVDDGVPEYAARVNGVEVDLASLDAMTNQIFNRYQSLYQQIGQDVRTLLEGASGALFRLQLQADAANELIRRALFKQEADRRGIRIPRDEVEDAFLSEYTNVLQANQITEDQLVNYLATQGSSLEAFQASLRAEAEVALIDEAVRVVVAGPIEPSDEDLFSYFETNIVIYDVEERVHAAHILVEDLETALEVRSLLDEGADFAELASTYSIDTNNKESGGDLDWFGRGVMVAEFEDAVFSMEIGELSQPIQTQFGYHIISLIDREEAHTPKLSDVRDDVLADYTRDKRDERVSEWYDAQYDASEIEVAFPPVYAYMLQQRDEDLGLAEFERLLAEGETSDLFLPYYIGRIHETKAAAAAEERRLFEEIEEPTEDNLIRIEELRAVEEEHEQAALKAYLAALENVEADESFLNRILRLNPDSVSATFLLGKLFLDRGDSSAAEARFAEVISKDETYVAAHIASGDLAVRGGDYPLARTRYENALALRPNDSSVMVKLVDVYLAEGSIDEARGLIDEIQAIDPGNVKAVIAEGDLARAQMAAAVEERDTLEAKALLTIEDEARLMDLAETIAALYDVAIQRYERGLQSGGSLELNVKIGEVHLLSGRLDEAEDEFDSVIIRSPYTSSAFEGLGRVMLARGETEEALENLYTALARSFDLAERERIAELIVEVDPSDADMRMELASIYAQQFKWREAIREYAAVLERDPESSDASVGIAEAYRQRGERAAERASDVFTLIRLHEAIVETIAEQVGAGQLLGPEGLDALIELARLRVSIGDSDAALADLALVGEENPEYRADEVAELRLLVSGPPSEPVDDAAEIQTDAETLP
jgi:foldase protein PrsA